MFLFPTTHMLYLLSGEITSGIQSLVPKDWIKLKIFRTLGKTLHNFEPKNNNKSVVDVRFISTYAIRSCHHWSWEFPGAVYVELYAWFDQIVNQTKDLPHSLQQLHDFETKNSNKSVVMLDRHMLSEPVTTKVGSSLVRCRYNIMW